MKKIITLSAATLLAATLFAQVRIGIQAGAGMSKSSFTKEQDVSYDTKFIVSPAGGIVASFPLGENFALMPSLGFLQKGMKTTAVTNENGVTDKIKFDLRMNYLELPVNIAFRQSLGKCNLILGAGPSVGLGLGGKAKLELEGPTFPGTPLVFTANPFKRSDDFEEPFKRIDMSVNATTGVEFNNGMFVTANYLHGLKNISGSTDGEKFRNRTFSLTLGYFFGSRL